MSCPTRRQLIEFCETELVDKHIVESARVMETFALSREEAQELLYELERVGFLEGGSLCGSYFGASKSTMDRLNNEVGTKKRPPPKYEQAIIDAEAARLA